MSAPTEGGAKRTREEASDDDMVGPAPPPPGAADDDDDEQEVGPAMPPKAKKKKILAFEQVYLDSMPSASMYEKSYMHRDDITCVAVTPGTDFFITGSEDGHLKFWKKRYEGIEFRETLPVARGTGGGPERQRGRAVLRDDRPRQVREDLRRRTST